MSRRHTHLLAVVGERLVALELSKLTSVVPMLVVDTVPGGPPGLMGFANLAGEPVPVLKLRTLFGLPDVADDTDHRIVVVNAGTTLGLVVDEVVGMGEPTARRSPTVDDRIVAIEVVSGLGLVGDRLCVILDPAVVATWLTRFLAAGAAS